MAKVKNAVKKVKGGDKGYYMAFKTKRDLEIYLAEQEWVAIQQALDICSVVLYNTFGFGELRQKRFHDEFSDGWNQMIQVFKQDMQIDKDLVWSKEWLDRLLRKATGKYFVPFDVRYGNPGLKR